MDVSIWVLALLMVQCVLMAMILLNSVLTSYLPNGVKAVEHPLARNAASLISLITEEKVTSAAAISLIQKTLANEKSTEAAVAFVQRITRRLLEDTLQLYEMEGEEGLPGVGERRDIGVRPGKESGADAADTVPLAAEGMISCGEGANVPEARRILPRSGAVMSDMEALELLVAESVERVKLSAARSYNAPHITDLIVRTVMDVVKDKRVEECCVAMLATVLARKEVTEAISCSITGVGSNMVSRIVPERFKSNKRTT